MQLRRSIGISGRHVMRFTLISDQDIPDPHPPLLLGLAGPGLLATKGASETRLGRLLCAIIRPAMPGPRPHEGAKVASLLREQRLSGQALQPSGIYRYLTRLRLHFASPHRLWRTYKGLSCRCHFEQI